jgi:hypothetical protein
MEVSDKFHAPAALSPAKEPLVPIRGWVGLRAGLDAVVKGNLPAPAGTRTSDHPSRSPALSLSYPGSSTTSLEHYSCCPYTSSCHCNYRGTSETPVCQYIQWMSIGKLASMKPFSKCRWVKTKIISSTISKVLSKKNSSMRERQVKRVQRETERKQRYTRHQNLRIISGT